MVTDPKTVFMTRTADRAVDVDAGLRAHMLRVYNYMGGALAVTGVVSYIFGNSEALLTAVYGTPLAWVVMFAPLVIAFIFGFRINSMSPVTAQALFWTFAAVMGVSISYIFAIYTTASIAKTFFITSGMFLAMSLYGYTTKKDLTAWGSFLFMGLIGLILASLVNLFVASAAMDFVISAIGVLIFTGLTAYDTQKIKEMYWEADSHGVATKKAVFGALQLYLDFINLFLYLLRFLGNRE